MGSVRHISMCQLMSTCRFLIMKIKGGSMSEITYVGIHFILKQKCNELSIHCSCNTICFIHLFEFILGIISRYTNS